MNGNVFVAWREWSCGVIWVWPRTNSDTIVSTFIWFCYLEWMIWNGNWTGWSAIWAEIICMISKSNKRAALIWFEITSMTSDEKCTTRDSITTFLHPFWNRPNTGLGQFKYFIDAVLSRFEIKFIHFLGGKNKSFGNKSCKKFSFSCNLIDYFKQALKSDWLFCFWCSLLIGWEKDAI